MSEMRDRMMENLKRLNEIRTPVKTPEKRITRAESMEDLFSKIQKIDARLKEMA